MDKLSDMQSKEVSGGRFIKCFVCDECGEEYDPLSILQDESLYIIPAAASHMGDYCTKCLKKKFSNGRN